MNQGGAALAATLPGIGALADDRRTARTPTAKPRRDRRHRAPDLRHRPRAVRGDRQGCVAPPSRLVGRPDDGPDPGRRPGQGPALPVHRRPAGAHDPRGGRRAPARLSRPGRRPRPRLAPRAGGRPRAAGDSPRRNPRGGGPVRGRAHGPPVHRRVDADRGVPDRPRPPAAPPGLHRGPAGRGRHKRDRGRRLPGDLASSCSMRPLRPARTSNAKTRRSTATTWARSSARRASRSSSRASRPTSTPSTPRTRPAASSDGSGRSSGRPARWGRTSTSTWSSTSTRG